MENQTLSPLAKADVMAKILVVAPSWIGDAVLSLPAIDASGRFWPDAEIAILARTGVPRES